MKAKCLWTHTGLESNQSCCLFSALAPCPANLHVKMILLIPGRCHWCSCDSEGWNNTYTLTLGVLISFTREVLSKFKGIVNLVDKSLLESAECNQMRPLFSLKGFGVRITNQMANWSNSCKKSKIFLLTPTCLTLYPHSSDLFVHLADIFSSCHL